jgi:hypothetical protein
MAGHKLTLKMYRRAGTASLEKSNILRINMLKKFLLMLAMCSFAQPVQAREVLALQAATEVMMGATAVTGGLVFVAGMWATLYHHCLSITEKHQHTADTYRRDRNQDACVALAGGVACLLAACLIDAVNGMQGTIYRN